MSKINNEKKDIMSCGKIEKNKLNKNHIGFILEYFANNAPRPSPYE